MKLLASQLEQTDIIANAFIERLSVHAVYKTGIRDRYYFRLTRRDKQRGDNCFVVRPASAAIRHEVPIFREFHDDPLDTSPTYHWCINRTQFNDSTLVERRMAMHRLLREILNTKPLPDCYPDRILDEDWEQLQSADIDPYVVNGAITCFPMRRRLSHFRILEHFFNPGANERGKYLWRALQCICYKKTVRINSSNVRKVARWFSRRRIINPLVYCAIFKALGISGPIGDLDPGYGSKALACAMLDLPYYTVRNDRFQRALDLGFASFTRAEFGWLEDQNLELLISDNNFNGFAMPEENVLSRARRMLCYAPRGERQRLIDKYHPTNVLKLYDNHKEALILRDSNYLFLW